MRIKLIVASSMLAVAVFVLAFSSPPAAHASTYDVSFTVGSAAADQVVTVVTGMIVTDCDSCVLARLAQMAIQRGRLAEVDKPFNRAVLTAARTQRPARRARRFIPLARADGKQVS